MRWSTRLAHEVAPTHRAVTAPGPRDLEPWAPTAELLGRTSAAWEVFDEAKKLPLDEGQALAEALWDSLDVEPTSLSPEWTAGVSSRIAQLERGEVTAIP